MGEAYIVRRGGSFDLPTPPITIQTFDIFTGWTKTSTSGIVTHDADTFHFDKGSSHAKGRMYKNLGTNTGAISFNYRYGQGEGSYSTSNSHTIWRVRTSSVSSGNYYNADAYTGWELYYNAGNTKQIVFSKYKTNPINTSPGSVDYIVKNWDLQQDVTKRISISWDTEKVEVWVAGEYFKYEFDSPVTNLTYVEKGYALYDGEVYMDVLNNITEEYPQE